MARMRQCNQIMARLQMNTWNVRISGKIIASLSGDQPVKINSSAIVKVLHRGWLRLALQAANKAGNNIILS